MTHEEKVNHFLSVKNIAFTGFSRDGNLPANINYKKMKQAGYNVFAVNPAVKEVDGEKCYQSLEEIPDSIDAVFVGVPAHQSIELAKACKKANVNQLWLHQSIVQGSYSEDAVQFCEENGIEVISQGCPMMYIQPVDIVHRCFRWIMKSRGKFK